MNRRSKNNPSFAGLAKAEKFRQLLAILETEKEKYSREYDLFVKGVSYAAEGEVPDAIPHYAAYGAVMFCIFSWPIVQASGRYTETVQTLMSDRMPHNIATTRVLSGYIAVPDPSIWRGSSDVASILTSYTKPRKCK